MTADAPPARAPARAPRLIALLLVVGLLCGLRVAIVGAYRAPAGDGQQYYRLSQELLLRGRLAFGPPPTPLGFTRMPGYPLFLAYAAVRAAPVSIQEHLRRATAANLVLDAGTAGLVAGMLRLLFPGLGAVAVGLLLTLSCPLLVMLSCYGLSESLATFLTALQLYLLLRLWRPPASTASSPPGAPLREAALLGVALGLALLTRGDAVLMLPVVGWVLLRAERLRTVRVRAIALLGLLMLGLYLPWPLRNLRQLGQPYWFSWYWRTMDGKPLPLSPIRWARTWASGAPGESYLDLMFALELPVDPARPGIVLAAMYDDAAERQQVVALLQRYNRERFSPGVQADFEALAANRWRRAPLRALVALPLRRLRWLWSPLPEYELPLRVPWLRLPQGRWVLGAWDQALCALALLGAWRLWRRGGWPRRALLPLLGYVAVRSALLPVLVPIGLTERHIIEAYPAVLALAGCGVLDVAASRARRGRALSP